METYFQLILPDAVRIAILAAVIGFVYVTILTQPGHVLRWWYELLWDGYNKVFPPEKESHYKYKWIMNPILECELCVSGQLALWIFLFTAPFNLINLIFCICLSILIAKILSKALS